MPHRQRADTARCEPRQAVPLRRYHCKSLSRELQWHSAGFLRTASTTDPTQWFTIRMQCNNNADTTYLRHVIVHRRVSGVHGDRKLTNVEMVCCGGVVTLGGIIALISSPILIVQLPQQ